MKNFSRKTYLSTTALIIFVVCLINNNRFSVKFASKQKQHDDSSKFENIVDAIVQPSHARNIFFVESSDSATLNARQCCAIESAAAANPDLEVFVIFTSKERLGRLNETEEVKALWLYPNVHFNFIDIEEFSKSTPLENFVKRGRLKASSHKNTHTLDTTRLLLLWRYGGTYLDLYTISRQNFDSVPSNFACPVTDTYLNPAILNLDLGDGRKIAEILMEYTSQYFDGNDESNSQLILTDVVSQLCNATSTSQMTFIDNCRGFHVLHRPMCFAVNSYNWEWLVKEEFAEDTLMRVVGSLVVHFWNQKTKNIELRKDSKAAYVQLAREHCPRVMQSGGEYF